MASAGKSDEERPSESESDVSDESESDKDSDDGTDSQSYNREPCKFYNGSGCRDSKCSYLHVCKYALKGNCRYGSKCKLNHNTNTSKGALGPSATGHEEAEETTAPKLIDGRLYQWQLHDGNSWMDIDNDHVIEAQYSLPHSKSIKVYNTSYGAISIDFNRMRVYGKSLKVRRLDDGNTIWLWYCTLRGKWKKYGEKDSKGNPGPVKSADIETKFQSNPKSTFTFNIGSEALEIKFREMKQVGKSRTRKVTRRPLFRIKQAGAGGIQAASAFQNLSLGTKPQWQYEGDRGAWHDYEHGRGTQSGTTEEIEKKYQQNPNDRMFFKLKGNSYMLDFKVEGREAVNTEIKGLAMDTGGSDDTNQLHIQAFTQDQTCAGVRMEGDLKKEVCKPYQQNHC